MYKMPEFTEQDNARLLQFIKDHPFITLIGNDGMNSVATQVPVLIEERNDKLCLRGHIMRQTDHYKAFSANNNALILFTGPHCYVSASWYKERNIGSTWNYMTVHARGKLRFTDDAATVQLLTDLTHKYEAKQEYKELVENMPAEYVNGMVKAIAGFEIEIEDIYPLFKLSQNRSDESYKNIVAKLEAENDNGAEEIAGEMMSRRPDLFGL
jgi:transcriptional regulator